MKFESSSLVKLKDHRLRTKECQLIFFLLYLFLCLFVFFFFFEIFLKEEISIKWIKLE